MCKRRTAGTLSLATAAVIAVLSPPCGAEVIDANESGFTTRHSLTISAARDEVYRTSVGSIGSWWNDDHTVSGRAANMYLEAKPQGCLCERLGENAGVVHMTVTFVNPAVMLRLSGGLGPLGLMGVNGNMTWEFADSDEGTTVTWSYAVGGYFPGGLEQMAGAVDDVLTGQMDRLKRFVEE